VNYCCNRCNLGVDKQEMIEYPELSDNELLLLLAQSDERAFSEVYNRHWSKLFAIAYGHTKDRYLAEETVQEVFISVWNRREIIKINSLKAYLATAVKFSIFKTIFNQNRRERIVGSIVQKRDALTDEVLHAKLLQEYIDGIVEQLPEKCRMVYLYSRNDGMAAKAIAAEMGISKKTVETHLTKALKILKVNLKDFLAVAILMKYL
jgi:RNA polymerase sigma-70 factor (family 1)